MGKAAEAANQGDRMKLQVPVHVFVRRLLMAGPLYAALSLAFVFAALGWGLDEARRFWSNVS